MSTLYASAVRQRVIFVTLVLGLWFGVVLGRLIQLQVLEHARLKAEVLVQNQNEITIRPRRGSITDRHGLLLARSLPVRSIYLAPARQDSTETALAAVDRLKDILSLSGEELARIEARIRGRSAYILLKRKVKDDVAERAAALNIRQIFMEEESRRFYPQHMLAAHVLGRVGIDDDGTAGVEQRYNGLLAGKPGKRLIYRDARRREYQIETMEEATPGQDLRLTIDGTIQFIAESALSRAVEDCAAAWGSVIVTRPSTGEVLAMATCPAYDPNDTPLPDETVRNRAIAHLFEPGSTFKIVTAAAARETGRVGYGDVFDCSAGVITFGRMSIRDHKRLGVLSFADVIAQSSNVGTVMAAQRIGERPLHDMVRRFGFGRRTDIDLPGEEKGIVYPLESWNKIASLPHVAIGYEVMVSALQVVHAMNIMANRGLSVRPRITLDAETPPPAERILTEATADELIRRVFTKVVEEGTGTTARLREYVAAGKTGTAQKVVDGRYTSARHVASFVGFAPAADPAISIVVVIDDPRGYDKQYGGQSAAPVFREVADRVLRYLGIPPEREAPPVIAAAGRGVDLP